MRGISLPHLNRLLAYAKSERTTVRLERAELHQIIAELKHRRAEGKKLRPKCRKQAKQIVNIAAKLK